MKKIAGVSTLIAMSLFAYNGIDGYVPSWRSALPLTHKLYSIDIAQERSKGLAYLNMMRQKAGLTDLKLNDALNTAAQNHANYMVANNVVGHYENADQYPTGFTGVGPGDRAVYAGYKSREVIENLSTGQNDINESVDDLFSAIYHRFGFMDVTVDELGIGIATSSTLGNVYNYDMANSYLNELCNGSGFSGTGRYYMRVCADVDLKIGESDYINAKKKVADNNPQVIIWPPAGMEDVPPVFYEEYPDPLPDFSVSGYPISVEFNKYKFSTLPRMDSFKLYDENSSTEIPIRALDAQSDPNSHLAENQYAIFPLQRLDWGRVYRAELTYYDYDKNESETLIWKFRTKDMKYPYYKVDPDNPPSELDVVSGKEYALYLDVKNGVNVRVSSYTYTVAPNMENIDENTIRFSVNGSIGDYVIFHLSNGKDVKIVVAESDNALPPTTGSGSLPTNIKTLSGLQKEMIDAICNAPTGKWMLDGALDDLNVSDINCSYTIIWMYQDGWKAYSPDSTIEDSIKNNPHIEDLQILKRGKGYWYYK